MSPPPVTRARTRALAAESALQALARKERSKQQRRSVRVERTRGYKEQFQGCGYNKKLTKEQLRVAVLDGLIPYAVADSGCTTTCVKPLQKQIKVSECGHYKWAGEPFTHTGNESNKCFQWR